jgi:hypothetical protein
MTSRSSPQRSLLSYFSASPSSSPASASRKRSRQDEEANGDDNSTPASVDANGQELGSEGQQQRKAVVGARRAVTKAGAAASSPRPSPLRAQQRAASPRQPPAKRARKAEAQDEAEAAEVEAEVEVEKPKAATMSSNASPLTPYRGTRGTNGGRRVRSIKLEEEDDVDGDDGHQQAEKEDDDYQPMDEEAEEEEEYHDDEHEEVDDKAKTKRRTKSDCERGDKKPALRQAKKEEQMEEESESRVPVALGDGEVVTRDSVNALVFKPGSGAQRTKEERAERLREILGRPTLTLVPDAAEADDTKVVSGGKGGKAGQMLFREKHRHWIAEANQKDAQGRSRDDPAYDPSTLHIPRKVRDAPWTLGRMKVCEC